MHNKYEKFSPINITIKEKCTKSIVIRICFFFDVDKRFYFSNHESLNLYTPMQEFYLNYSIQAFKIENFNRNASTR